MYVYECMYVDVNMSLFVYAYVYACDYVCLCVCLRVCMGMGVCVSMYE